MLQFAITLNVILTSGEVPHEIAPVHEVTLIRKEEPDVLELARHLDHHGLATTIIGHLCAADTTHPRFVSAGMTSVIHTWEEHVLRIFVFILRTDYKVRVFLVGRGFLLTLVDGLALRHDGLANVTLYL